MLKLLPLIVPHAINYAEQHDRLWQLPNKPLEEPAQLVDVAQLDEVLVQLLARKRPRVEVELAQQLADEVLDHRAATGVPIHVGIRMQTAKEYEGDETWSPGLEGLREGRAEEREPGDVALAVVLAVYEQLG